MPSSAPGSVPILLRAKTSRMPSSATEFYRDGSHIDITSTSGDLTMMSRHVRSYLTAMLFVMIVAPTGASAQGTELASFSVSPGDHSINLAWRTAAESNNAGFEIHRSGANDTASFKAIASYLTDSK